MQPTSLFEHANWRDQVYRMMAQTKRKAVDIVTEEVKWALEYVMKFTPPDNHAQGRKAVKRDITRTMRPLVPKDITESKRLARIVREDDQKAFNDMARHMKSGTLKNVRAVTFSPVEHTRYRDRRGRVIHEHGQVVLGNAAATKWRRYLSTVQERVGWAKAGWAAALEKVGGIVPAWVKRHAATAGSCIDERKHPHGPVFTVVNNTQWGARDGRRVSENALKVRSNVMRRKIDRMIREEATKSGATVSGGV